MMTDCKRKPEKFGQFLQAIEKGGGDGGGGDVPQCSYSNVNFVCY